MQNGVRAYLHSFCTIKAGASYGISCFLCLANLKRESNETLSLLLISLVWSLATFADDVTIPIIFVQQDEVEVDERSLSFAPEASHDGHTVSVYSYVPMEEIQISVLDEGGNVVYEDTVAGNCSFTLGSQVKGELTLLLETKDAVYKGIFYLE